MNMERRLERLGAAFRPTQRQQPTADDYAFTRGLQALKETMDAGHAQMSSHTWHVFRSRQPKAGCDSAI